jgi:hypothetical protein
LRFVIAYDLSMYLEIVWPIQMLNGETRTIKNLWTSTSFQFYFFHFQHWRRRTALFKMRCVFAEGECYQYRLVI